MIATTTNGSKIEITLAGRDLKARVLGADINLGGVDLISDNGIEARFPTEVNGKRTRIAAYFGDEDYAKIEALAAEAGQQVSDEMAFEARHADRVAGVHKMMGQ